MSEVLVIAPVKDHPPGFPIEKGDIFQVKKDSRADWTSYSVLRNPDQAALAVRMVNDSAGNIYPRYRIVAHDESAIYTEHND